MNNYAPPLQGTANSLARHGRYGDSMLVHMNPIEVQGIAALSPTGKLTTNPVTGQQEAFLPFLAPLLGSAFGLSALGTAALSGALTALQTGSLKKGILSGVLGFGIGKVFSGLGAATAATDATTTAATTAADAATAATTTGVLAPVAEIAGSTTGSLVDPVISNIGNVDNLGAWLRGGVGDAAGSVAGDVAGGVAGDVAAPWYQGLLSEGKTIGDEGYFTDLSKRITSKEALPGLLMAGTAGSELGRLDAQEKLAARLESDEMSASSDRAQSEEEIQRAIRQRIYDYGMPSRGIDPLDSRYSPTAYANSGGLVSLNPMDYQNKRRGLAQLTGEPVRMANGGASPYSYGMGNYYGGQTGGYTPNIQASEAQSALRGSQLISAPQMQELYSSGYRPGFGPELQYFREPDRFDNDPFAGNLDPMNPNAPIIPTEEQLASEVIPEESDEELPITLPGGSDWWGRGGFGYGNNAPIIPTEEQLASEVIPEESPVDGGYGGFRGFGGLSNYGLPTQAPQQVTGESQAPVKIPAQSDVSMMGSAITPELLDFDLPALRERLSVLENNKIPAYSAPDLSAYTRTKDIPTYDDFQSREELNEQIKNLSKRNFRFNSGGLVRMQDIGQVPEMPVDPAIMQNDPMQSGIAAVDPAIQDPTAGIDPAMLQMVEQTAMAVLGRVPPEQADAIIQAFIQQFGPEAFQALRQEVLNSVEPNAQTEGIIEGEGDGMSDEVMGMIGDQQRVAVSPGEYIVPADVVSGIGNGSSDAGAGELDSMLEKIRQARTGMTGQPPAIDPRGAMPV